MSNGYVDAVQLLSCVTRFEVLLLVDDCVDCNGSLASLAIANDQLTLACVWFFLKKMFTNNEKINNNFHIFSIIENPYIMSMNLPLPIGTRQSTALRPVCMGSFTD